MWMFGGSYRVWDAFGLRFPCFCSLQHGVASFITIVMIILLLVFLFVSWITIRILISMVTFRLSLEGWGVRV